MSVRFLKTLWVQTILYFLRIENEKITILFTFKHYINWKNIERNDDARSSLRNQVSTYIYKWLQCTLGVPTCLHLFAQWNCLHKKKRKRNTRQWVITNKRNGISSDIVVCINVQLTFWTKFCIICNQKKKTYVPFFPFWVFIVALTYDRYKKKI